MERQASVSSQVPAVVAGVQGKDVWQGSECDPPSVGQPNSRVEWTGL